MHSCVFVCFVHVLFYYVHCIHHLSTTRMQMNYIQYDWTLLCKQLDCTLQKRQTLLIHGTKLESYNVSTCKHNSNGRLMFNFQLAHPICRSQQTGHISVLKPTQHQPPALLHEGSLFCEMSCYQFATNRTLKILLSCPRSNNSFFRAVN